MTAIKVIAVTVMALLIPEAGMAVGDAAVMPDDFAELAASCAPEVHPDTLRAVISTESSGNPYAIGVVGEKLSHQPHSLDEAVAIARTLAHAGKNFSLGLMQVNRHNLARFGVGYMGALDPCTNMRIGSRILTDCYRRASGKMGEGQKALHAALSCYYSGGLGNFQGNNYAQQVVQNAGKYNGHVPVVPAIEVVGSSNGQQDTVSFPFSSAVMPAVARQSQDNSSNQNEAPLQNGQKQWVTFATNDMTPSTHSAVAVHPVTPVRLEEQGSNNGDDNSRNEADDSPFVQFVK